MNAHQPPCARRGLTLLELLLVIGVVAVLAVLCLPALRNSSGCRGRPVAIVCLNQLKQVTLAEIVWENDHELGSLPAAVSTNRGGLREIVLEGRLKEYYQALSNEVTSPQILTCPSNPRGPVEEFRNLTADHLSYFLNADAVLATDFSTAIHGDRQLEFSPPAPDSVLTLNSNAMFRWTKDIHHQGDQSGNVAHMDGSVQRVPNGAALAKALRVPAQARHRLVFP